MSTSLQRLEAVLVSQAEMLEIIHHIGDKVINFICIPSTGDGEEDG